MAAAECPACSPEGLPKKEDNRKAIKYFAEDHYGPYVPGIITPAVKKVYPPGAPPRYLPQPTDTTSGDTLSMGPIGPWAPGHMDWNAAAGMTGVRPVVDKYSITRYSTNQWRANNEKMLNAVAMSKGKEFEADVNAMIDKLFKDIDKKGDDTKTKLEERVKEVTHWTKQVLKEQKAMENELNTLEEARVKIKSASRILMMPEAIAKECLELRTHRYEPDQVRDDAEQELIKEVAIVGEIRRVFDETLAKVNEQLANNKAAKAAIEMDWDNKMTALREDKKNLKLNSHSTTLEKHPGVDRWVDNSITYEFWKHWCQESIRNCAEVRKKSEDLRADLMTAIVKGGQDLKTQGERTNSALEDTVSVTEELCAKLEDYLRETLQKIADIENLIDTLMAKQRELEEKSSLCETRLHSRNYKRPNAENCQDPAQYALMDEKKFIDESLYNIKNRLREAQGIRADLMKYRGDLEKDIASKRKALNIDRDRFKMIRAHMPSAEDFAAA